MAAGEIHQWDIGTAFQAVCLDENSNVINISAATTLEMWFMRPDQSYFSVPATLVTDGADGLLQYVTQPGDLNQAGAWKVQGHVVIGVSSIHSDITKIKVLANIFPNDQA